MALNAACIFEVQTGGNDNNGGGYVSGAGTDRSQSTSAFVVIDNSTITCTTPGANSNTLTFTAGYTATSADVNNVVQILTGTNINPGFYQITGFTASTWTLTGATNLTTAAGAGSAITGNMGGCLASPGKAASAMVAGNTMYIKAGTYTVNNATTNVSGGCVSLPGGASGASVIPTSIIGYQTTRGDNGTKPLLQASGISTFSLIAFTGTTTYVSNLSLDGAGLTSSAGIVPAAGQSIITLCKLANFTNRGLNLGSSLTNVAILCEITGCSAQTATSGGCYYGCVSHDNTITGISPNNNGSSAYYCLSYNNTGSTSDGFGTGGGGCLINCTAYNNGRHGFNISAGNVSGTLINCLAANHTAVGAFGFAINAAIGSYRLYNCAGYNNTTQASTSYGLNVGFVTLSAPPFNNAGTDFGPNSTGTGGALLINAGIPAASGVYGVPVLTGTPNWLDIGAIQARSGSPGILGC